MVCTNPNCHKDCPYAEAPDPRTFKCYECRLISDMMGNGKEDKSVKGQPRPVKVGDRVRRFRQLSQPEMYVVQYVGMYEFEVNASLTPSYSRHCVKGLFPYWEHEDGSPIIPPPKKD